MKKRDLLLISMVPVLLTVALVLYDEELNEDTRAWLTPVQPPSDYKKGLGLLRAFNERTDAYRLATRASDNTSSDKRAMAACSGFTVQCIAELRRDETTALRYMPRESEYYDHYFELLEHSIVAYKPEDLDYPKANLVSTTRFSFLNDMLIHGAVRPDTVIRNLEGHRRGIAESHFLIDRIIFLATFSISIEAARVAMSVDHPWAIDLRNDDRFLAAIRPLGISEYSFSRVFDGELDYMMAYLDGKEYPVPWHIRSKRNALLNQQQVDYQALVNQSELETQRFWSSEIPEQVTSWQNYILFEMEQQKPQIYQGYLDTTRNLDNQLAVLRALRRVYLGADPTMHGEGEIPGFHWAWGEKRQELCLKPSGIEHDETGTERPARTSAIPSNCMSVSPMQAMSKT